MKRLERISTQHLAIGYTFFIALLTALRRYEKNHSEYPLFRPYVGPNEVVELARGSAWTG